MSVLRVLDPADAEVLSRLQAENRAHLAPWSPLRDEHWLSAEGQLEIVERRLVEMVEGRAVGFVILDETGDVVGEITLDGIVRGPFQNAHVGYWLAGHATGRGLMTRAVEELATHAFDVMGLHRLQAGTLPHNTASQAVLRRCGFAPYGTAPRYLQIQGWWQDHVLFQRLAHDEPIDP